MNKKQKDKAKVAKSPGFMKALVGVRPLLIVGASAALLVGIS